MEKGVRWWIANFFKPITNDKLYLLKNLDNNK